MALAHILRDEGLAVPETLAFTLWDKGKLLPGVRWALEHGAARTHPTDGRRLIDLFLQAGQLPAALGELHAGERPGQEGVFALVKMVVDDGTRDDILLAAAGRRRERERESNGRAWAALWDALPDALDVTVGLEAPELLQPFFETPRRSSAELGAWLVQKIQRDGTGDARSQRSWLGLVKSLADAPVVARARARL